MISVVGIRNNVSALACALGTVLGAAIWIRVANTGSWDVVWVVGAGGWSTWVSTS